MFLNNKYTKWYFEIIDNAKLASRTRGDGNYYESHHIIPRSLGGKEEVLLTAKEHFICHLLLCKMLNGSPKYKMVNALIKMTYSKSAGQQRYNAKSYSLVRKFVAEKNSAMFKGKPKSDTAKKNMKGRSGTWKRNKESSSNQSAAQYKRFENSEGTFKNKKHTTETKAKMSRDRKGTTVGKKFYTNGVVDKLCYPGQEPDGFWLGITNTKWRRYELAKKE